MKYNTATDVVVVAPEILGSIQYMNNNNNNNNHIINNNNFNNNNNINNNNNNVNDALNMKETNGMRIGVGVGGGGGNGVGVGCLSSFNNITNFLQEDLMFCNNNINNLNHNILDGQMFNNNNNNYSETSKRELASLLSLIKATAEDATSSAIKSNAITTTTNAANCEITPTPPLAPQSASSLASTSTATILTDNATSPMFCDQVSTVMSLFEKWNDCERTVIMFALLKRLRYASLKFLLYSINNHVQHYLDKHDGGATTSQLDINANNKVFLENLLNMYRRATPKTTTTTTHINNNINNNNNNIDNSEITSKPAITKTTSLTSTKGLVEDFNFNVPPPPLVQHQTAATSISSSLSSSSSSSSSSASSTSSVSSTYGICVQPMSKDDILLKFLNLVPLLEPANIECKHIYMILLPIAIYDTLQQIVSTELVQQLLSYLLIHSAISGEDRKYPANT